MTFASAHASTVIAEGVENELVSDLIRSLDIPLGQGFGLGRPAVADDLLDAAAAWRARDTLRPLRPRHAPPRTRVSPAPQEQEDANGVHRIGVPRGGSRRGDTKQRRLTQNSDTATSGRAS